MKILDVDSEAIKGAIRDFEVNWRDTTEYMGWEQNRNYLHAIKYEGKMYPPKKIISIATGMPTRSFYGGTPSNSYLAERGFEIVRLRAKDGNENENQGPLNAQTLEIESDQEEPFNPQNMEDARDRTLRTVVARRGQAAFRRKLIDAFQGRCAISGCDLLPVLEAAHITPYLGPATNDVSNGLLLRADLHTLWDLGLIAIDPDKLTVWVSPTISDAMYRSFNAHVISPLPPKHLRPSIEALRAQWKLAVLGNVE